MFISKWGVDAPVAHLRFMQCLPANSLDLYFQPLINEFFDMLSYASELRKRYTLKLLLMCLDGGRVLKVILIVEYFRKKILSQISERVLKTSLSRQTMIFYLDNSGNVETSEETYMVSILLNII